MNKTLGRSLELVKSGMAESIYFEIDFFWGVLIVRIKENSVISLVYSPKDERLYALDHSKAIVRQDGDLFQIVLNEGYEFYEDGFSYVYNTRTNSELLKSLNIPSIKTRFIDRVRTVKKEMPNFHKLNSSDLTSQLEAKKALELINGEEYFLYASKYGTIISKGELK